MSGFGKGPARTVKSCIPLPWCTSQSRSRIFLNLSGYCFSTAFAATTVLLKKQKPIARAHSAWCPGGRTTANAFCSVPDATRNAADTNKKKVSVSRNVYYVNSQWE